jgi:uncharacterized protein (DUF2126 family)
LLELRAFEMPPHARTSIAQQLLIRALVARFWKQPYRARLTRWAAAFNTGKLQIPSASMNVPGSKEFPFRLDLRTAPRG